jgi:predicted nuclease of predicted toxin-antitoxin system
LTRIKLDENLPRRLAPRLRDLGHDVHTPDDENLRGVDDDAIWEAAQREERFLITQDLDFSDMRRFAPGTHNENSASTQSIFRRSGSVTPKVDIA